MQEGQLPGCGDGQVGLQCIPHPHDLRATSPARSPSLHGLESHLRYKENFPLFQDVPKDALMASF